jgi:hypothetical protein
MANKNANGRTGASGRNTGGGGINTKQHVRPTVRGGPPQTKIISVSAAADIGVKKGDHAMGNGRNLRRPADPLVQGTRPQVALGNQVALNVGRGGPGAGRVIHSSGSQGQQGKANPGVQGGSPFLPGNPSSGPAGMGFSGSGKVVKDRA